MDFELVSSLTQLILAWALNSDFKLEFEAERGIEKEGERGRERERKRTYLKELILFNALPDLSNF